MFAVLLLLQYGRSADTHYVHAYIRTHRHFYIYAQIIVAVWIFTFACVVVIVVVPQTVS